MNKYLEKIASTIDEDFEKARGTNTQLHLGGALGVNSRLKDLGYNSDFGKINRTIQRTSPGFLKTLAVDLGGAAAGAGTGLLLHKALKIHPLLAPSAAFSGALVGLTGASVAVGHNHLTKRFPAGLKEEMLAGTYSKKKKND